MAAFCHSDSVLYCSAAVLRSLSLSLFLSFSCSLPLSLPPLSLSLSLSSSLSTVLLSYIDCVGKGRRRIYFEASSLELADCLRNAIAKIQSWLGAVHPCFRIFVFPSFVSFFLSNRKRGVPRFFKKYIRPILDNPIPSLQFRTLSAKAVSFSFSHTSH